MSWGSSEVMNEFKAVSSYLERSSEAIHSYVDMLQGLVLPPCRALRRPPPSRPCSRPPSPHQYSDDIRLTRPPHQYSDEVRLMRAPRRKPSQAAFEDEDDYGYFVAADDSDADFLETTTVRRSRGFLFID